MLTDPPPAGPKPKKRWPWYRPVIRNWRRYYLRQFPRKKKLHGTLIHRLLGNRLFDPGLWLPTRDTVAWGMAIGMFIGMMPFLGLQIVLSILLCFAFRVNVTAAVLATFVSNPFTGAPILYAQREVGLMIIGMPTAEELEGFTGFAKTWVSVGKPIMFGAVVTGAAAAVLSYVLTLALWSFFSKAAGKAIAKRHARKLSHGREPYEDGEPGEEEADEGGSAQADSGTEARESSDSQAPRHGASGPSAGPADPSAPRKKD
jgi:uncharacterized protein (DUF2062 family)